MSYKGYYTIKNLEKYKGNPTNVVYRSLWERKFMNFCDNNSNVIEWSSEEIVIPYISPIDNKIHRYFVDFWVKLINKNKIIEEYLIEIKPMSKCIAPKNKKYINEWKINKAKWKSASNYAKEKNIKFKILTETHLNIN